MSLDIEKMTHDQIVVMWPITAGELSKHADHLSKNNYPIAADQVRFAIQMGERYFQMVNTVYDSGSVCPSVRETFVSLKTEKPQQRET
jgi:hypothetical protein